MADYVLSAVGKYDGSNFNSGMSRSENALSRFASKCKSVSVSAASGLAKITAAATAVSSVISAIATSSAVKGGIDRALNIEQAEYKLKQLGLDVQAVMKSADEAVTGTAHSLDAAATTAASLAASGVQAGDGMTRSLQAVAGMATLSGRSMEQIGLIFGKVAAQGKLQGDELMQFAESGVNATDALAKALGKTQAEVREMVRAGEIDFQTFSDAMYQAFGQAAYGANETFQGALANTNAAMSRLTAKFADPALDALRDVFQSAIPAINAANEALQPLVDGFASYVSDLTGRVTPAIDAFTEAVKNGADPVEALSDLVENLSDVAGDVFEDMAEFAAKGLSQMAKLAVKSLPGILKAITSGVTTLVKDLVPEIASMAPDIADAGLDLLGGLLDAVNEVIPQVSAELPDMIREIADSLRSNGASIMESGVELFRNLLQGLDLVVPELIALVPEVVHSLGEALVSYGPELATAAGTLLNDTIDAIVVGIAEMFGLINKDAADATIGLRDALSAINADYSDAVSGMRDVADAADDVLRSSDAALRAQGDIARDIKSTWTDIGTDSAVLRGYMDTIKELTSGMELNADQQAELALAVQGYNEITGSHIGIIDATHGKLDTQTDELDRNAEAWIRNAEAQAAAAEMVELKKSQLSIEQELQAVNKELETASEGWGWWIGDFAVIADEASVYYHDLVKRQNELTQAQQDNAAAQDFIKGKYEESSAALEQLGVSVSDVATLLSGGEFTEALRQIGTETGLSVDQITQKISDLGLSTEQLASVTPQNLQLIASAFQTAGETAPEAIQAIADALNLTGDQIATLCSNLGVEIPEALQQATSGTQAAVDNMKADIDASAGQAFNALPENAQSAVTETEGVINSFSPNLDDVNSQLVDMATNADANAASAKASIDTVPPQTEQANASLESVSETANSMSVEVATLLSNIVADITGMEGQFTAAGQALGNAFTSGFQAADMSAAVQAVQDAASQVQELSSLFAQAGSEHGQQYAQGISSQVGAVQVAVSALGSATSALSAYSGSSYTYGMHLGSQFAAGIRSQAGAVRSAAASLAAAAKANIGFSHPEEGPLRFGTEIYGRHLAENFSTGIDDGRKHVVSASNRLAQAVANYIAHSKPKLGPLAKGEEIFGLHAAENFADGLEKGNDAVSEASLALAEAVADYIGHSTPEKGPLAQGEWVFGYHAAVNFAEGLADGYSVVSEAAHDLADAADAEFEAYIDSMIAGYRSRAGEFKEISHDIGDFIWGVVSPGIDFSHWTLPGTGAVYDSMRILEDAGYTLDEFKRKAQDPPKPDEKGYAEWIDLNKRLTASLQDMERWASLSYMKSDLIDGISGAASSADTFGKLFSKAGVSYSKNFVDRVVRDKDRYGQALSDMANMTAGEVQEIVDSFDDLARAERLEEINQRSLWVNSLATLRNEGQDARDWLLDYREVCLDVKEAIYSDDGLSSAFDRAGVSVEGFAFDLQSLDETMDGFVSNLDSYTDKVTDGFSQMTKNGKTTFAEWRRNLQLNMAESQQYAQNLATVMNSIPEYVDSDAFRRAVYEGGFDQWGQVIADMAKMTSSELAEAVMLYNDAIVEAQQSAIEQFRALAPGEEIVAATVEGIYARQGQLKDAMFDTSAAANAAMRDTQASWHETGAMLAAGLSAGINSRSAEIALAATQAIRNAIGAAKAAAGIASPSKVARDEIGRMYGEGVVLGIEDMFPMVRRSSADLMDFIGSEVMSVPYSTPRGYKYSSALTPSGTVDANTYNYGDVNITATVRSDEDIYSLAREINAIQERERRASLI